MSPSTACTQAGLDATGSGHEPVGTAGLARPRRADVVVSYDLGAECYEELWSPVILPAAVGLISQMDLAEDAVVIDVGAGTGAIAPSIRHAVPHGSLLSMDASAEMLRIAYRRRAQPLVQADALALPVATDSVDAVLLAYVLFHLADPLVALSEAARVLRPGGQVGTVTWATSRPERAQLNWDAMLEQAGVPPLPVRSVYAGLDSPEAIGRLLHDRGFMARRVWMEGVGCQWGAESFWALVTGSGQNRRRLAAVRPEVRDRLLAEFRTQLDRLGPEDLRWEGAAVCAVAVKPAAPEAQR
jgi:SAM-dependent methyltransferase